MGIIKGITIQLMTRTEKGKDSFGTMQYVEEWVDVHNVLVGEPTTDEVTETLSLTGKKLAYVLAIPKGDTHEWRDRKVRFFGESFRTIGMPTQGIEALIPLSWNKKVRVERNE